MRWGAASRTVLCASTLGYIDMVVKSEKQEEFQGGQLHLRTPLSASCNLNVSGAERHQKQPSYTTHLLKKLWKYKDSIINTSVSCSKRPSLGISMIHQAVKAALLGQVERWYLVSFMLCLPFRQSHECSYMSYRVMWNHLTAQQCPRLACQHHWLNCSPCYFRLQLFRISY